MIHKVRCLFPEARKNGGSNQNMIETHYDLLTHPIPVQSRRANKAKKLLMNSLTYIFDSRRRCLQMRSGESDDLLFLPKSKAPVEPRKQRILKKNKDRFREVLRVFRADKN